MLVSIDLTDTERADIEIEAVELLSRVIELLPNQKFLVEESQKKEIMTRVCQIVLKEALSENRVRDFTKVVEQTLSSFLKDLSDKPDTSSFIRLQYHLLNWQAKHNLNKDWLLRYAYYFVSTFRTNSKIDVKEITIPTLHIQSLVSDYFRFEFERWNAGDEEREKYEERLREVFESGITEFFDQTSKHLGLEKIKRITKKIDYDRVKSLVRWTVQGWTIEKIVENDDQIVDNITNKYSFSRRVRYLRAELPKFDEFNLPYRKP
jgi:hypothetical protein